MDWTSPFDQHIAHDYKDLSEVKLMCAESWTRIKTTASKVTLATFLIYSSNNEMAF